MIDVYVLLSGAKDGLKIPGWPSSVVVKMRFRTDGETEQYAFVLKLACLQVLDKERFTKRHWFKKESS